MLAKARVRRRLRGGEGGRLSRCRAFHTCISRFSLRTSTGRPISLCGGHASSAGPAADRVTVDENCGPVRGRRPAKRQTRGHAHVNGVNNSKLKREQQSSWRKHSSGSTSTDMHKDLQLRRRVQAQSLAEHPPRPRRVVAASGRGTSSLRASLGDVCAAIRSASSPASATGATGSPWSG